MSEEDKSQKTEEPTEKKLKDERKKGNVPQSKEVGTFTAVFGLMIISAFMLPNTSAGLVDSMTWVFDSAHLYRFGEERAGIHDAGIATMSVLRKVGLAVLPIFMVFIVMALVGTLIQGEVVVALKRLQPKWSNISPVSGAKRIYGVGGLVEFMKALIKVFVVGTISYFVVMAAMEEILLTYSIIPIALATFIMKKATLLFAIVMSFLLVLSIADVFWKRYEWKNKLKMSMKEIKDEFKNTEGDPHIKAKLKEIRMTKGRQRMMQSVPNASVVIANPTHYSVALQYVSGETEAPVCVAKGTDRLALKIREVAKENDVPVLVNVPLARALHAVSEVDKVIPYDHWKAVADIIAYVNQLAEGQNVKPPEGSELVEDIPDF